MQNKNFFPILTCKESALFEENLLQNNREKTWAAIKKIGSSLAKTILEDYSELGPLPHCPKVLVLLGTGHNAADALLTASEILNRIPEAKIYLHFALGREKLRPLTEKALSTLPPTSSTIVSLEFILEESFDISIDGILGMSFHPPVKNPLLTLINQINNHPNIHFRASVDIPSGLLLKANFSYATGIAKTPLFEKANQSIVGRIRFLDIGFFENDYSGTLTSNEFILRENTLNPLKQLRDPFTDKRNFGHLFIISGSRNYPGALMMSVKSAIQSGVGLVTVFAPQSLVPSFAANVPEAMWVPFPETKCGSLALSGIDLFFENLPKARAVLTGPGLGQNDETLQLIADIVRQCPIAMVLDANALVPKVFKSAKQRESFYGPLIATPHLGEFERFAGEEQSLLDWNSASKVTTLLKGPISKIAHNGTIYNSTFGGPVLARGGSGDILSGLVGGLLAQNPDDPFAAISKAVVWHGMAADLLARAKGQVAVRTTDICHYLSPVLHNNYSNE